MRVDKPEQLGFCQNVSLAMIRLKRQLQCDYEQAYPDLRDIIPTVLDQEEKHAWQLSPFPHLLLPALLEARCGSLGIKFNLTHVCCRPEDISRSKSVGQLHPKLSHPLPAGKPRTLGSLAIPEVSK